MLSTINFTSTFALYTGTESKEEKEIVRKIYNGLWSELSPSLSTRLKMIADNNDLGEVIKVFMITASGSEGINLKNTRYVHIMEPYWHPARLEQIIGRARRICSHNDLPLELQTVEVFLYLMEFSKEQITSDASIELKIKDLSKKTYKVNPDDTKGKQIPFTSDEALYEISTIKEQLTDKLLTSIKESSIDCAIYSKRGEKEQLHCLQFGDVSPNSFSYNPSLEMDQPDSVSKINKRVLEWTGKEVTIYGKTYIYRKVDSKKGNLYDLESYKRALEVPGVEPTLIGTLEKNAKGEMIFKKI